MVADLSASLVEAMALGDIEAARVAHAAIGQLLATTASTAVGAEVVDLARRRERDPK